MLAPGASLLVVAIIPLLAGVLALVMRRAVQRSAIVRAIAAAALLMPSYVAYAMWEPLRAPGTPLGDWLLSTVAASASAPDAQRTTLPVLASRFQAVLALSLWSWPIVLLVALWHGRSIGAPVQDAIRLDAPSRPSVPRLADRLAHAALVARIDAPSLAWGVAASALILLGSCVPLHLAQFSTPALRAWLALQSSDVRSAWIAVLPTVTVTTVAAIGLGIWLSLATVARQPLAAPFVPTRQPAVRRCTSPIHALAAVGRWSAAGVVLLLSLPVPILIIAISARRAVPWSRFVRDFGPSLTSSVILALATAVCVLFLATVCAACFGPLSARWRLGRSPRMLPRTILLSIALALALTPGVMIGSLVAGLAQPVASRMGYPAWIDIASVVLAHTIRFGFIGVIVGTLLADRVPHAERDRLALDHPRRPLRRTALWLRSCWPFAVVVLALAAALSFHEVEASVVLLPPGVHAFPVRVLQLLHLFQWSELSWALLTIAMVSLALAAAAIGCLHLVRRASRPPTGPADPSLSVRNTQPSRP